MIRRGWYAVAADLQADPRELAIATAQALIAAPFLFAALIALFWLLATLSEAIA